MASMLLQFLDFIYNDVLIDVDVLDEIDHYIELHHGEGIARGGFMYVYRKWYREPGGPNE
jgi:hypothetical protein